MNERRGTRRFAVSLPVMIWKSGQSSALGTTRDISSNGVYFFLDQPLRPGADIDLAVRLTTEITQGREMFLWASGRTVRLEDSPDSPAGRIGVAALINCYHALRNESPFARCLALDTR